MPIGSTPLVVVVARLVVVVVADVVVVAVVVAVVPEVVLPVATWRRVVGVADTAVVVEVSRLSTTTPTSTSDSDSPDSTGVDPDSASASSEGAEPDSVEDPDDAIDVDASVVEEMSASVPSATTAVSEFESRLIANARITTIGNNARTISPTVVSRSRSNFGFPRRRAWLHG